MKRFMYLFALLVFGAYVSGCAVSETDSHEENVAVEETAQVVSDEDLIAEDTAVVIDVNVESKKIILQTIEKSLRYELSYDGKTNFSDKYGEIMTAAQMEPGDIVDVSISIHSKMLNSMSLSKDTFSLKGVKNHVYSPNKHMMTIGDDNYKVSDKIAVIMGKEIGGLEDIIDNDIISVKGVGREILSISIDSGHGYLKLSGEKPFIGGWLEIGSVIKPISEDMLVLVPEGNYEMRITYHGRGGSKPVKIVRDKETRINVADLKDEILQSGRIDFEIKPEHAKLKINDEEVMWHIPVDLEYGVYRISVTCDGYTSVNEYLSVGQEKAKIEIELEKEENDTVSKNSSASSSSTSSSTNPREIASSSVSVNKISSSSSSSSLNGAVSDNMLSSRLFINGPEGVEVYFDGNYMGVAPLSFTKPPGTHVVTLRKEGYVTKSYTITLTNENIDENYSFDELSFEEHDA